MDKADKLKLSESDICDLFITPAIKKAGWDPFKQIRREVTLAPGPIVVRGDLASRNRKKKFADYVLSWQPAIPGAERNPTRGIRRAPLNNGRERFLTPEETVRLKAAVAASQNPQLQHIVGLLLLTGARLRELLDARWENVDVERRSWFIPTSKTGRSRHVPISTPALAIIEKLPRFKDCPYLVPNPDTRLPFVSIKHGWQTAIKEANLPGLRLHDLRHSAASNMVNGGVDLFAVGKVLGHASYQSTQRYAHLANDTLLKAVEAGAAKQTAF
ncbi:tyrosine-type recombinase/integrase [Brevundimonas sp.]|uniref:site-specific integrase n=1 Tax=Brevundimonas sp. TaxID=1871086 RepID=UPI0019855467|nr:tyrosine-type recombinase/integrase [Brevundimonas sp.]MBD3838029.1 tyrosine-type recombinase/integrase [Brevundimonas sp.]